jgi:hypothetical protein
MMTTEESPVHRGVLGVNVRGKNLKDARKQLTEAAQAFLDETARTSSGGWIVTAVSREKTRLEI